MGMLSIKAHDTMLSPTRLRLPFAPAVTAEGPGLPISVVTGDAVTRACGAERRRLWELSPPLHCSIIGTCLTTGELREILGRIARKEGLTVRASSDHDLHGLGVRFAQRRDRPGKLLHKALDRRHGGALRSFASATDEAGVEVLWRDALDAGAIPGAYWSVLTHRCTGEGLVRRAFGEVHMLSHLVGASNRADIVRLRALEAQNAGLQTELAAERRGRRQALSERDARVRTLERQLQMALAATPDPPPAAPLAAPEDGPAEDRVAILEARLAKADQRRAASEERCVATEAELAWERERRDADRIEIEGLGAEVDALQRQLRGLLADAPGPGLPPARPLGGARVLVVGARPAQIGHWRALVERQGGELLHHDGGVDDNIVTLAGLVSRAGLILFPVDCVSHEAMWSVKRLATQQGKPFAPMRTASLAAFAQALQQMALHERC